jgi:hypothetical protein
LEILQYEAFPAGLFDNISVGSDPIGVLSLFKPKVHRIRIYEPPSEYRIVYCYDEPNDVNYIISIRRRPKAYPMTLRDIKSAKDVARYWREVNQYRKEVRIIMDDYYNNRRWEDGA